MDGKRLQNGNGIEGTDGEKRKKPPETGGRVDIFLNAVLQKIADGNMQNIRHSE